MTVHNQGAAANRGREPRPGSARGAQVSGRNVDRQALADVARGATQQETITARFDAPAGALFFPESQGAMRQIQGNALVFARFQLDAFEALQGPGCARHRLAGWSHVQLYDFGGGIEGRYQAGNTQ